MEKTVRELWLEGTTGWVVKLRKSYSIWAYDVLNPHGGSYGSSGNSGQPQWMVLATALRSVPEGASYELVVNGKSKGLKMKGGQS